MAWSDEDLDQCEIEYAKEQFERCLRDLDARDQARLRRELAIQMGVKDLGLIHLSPTLQPLLDAEVPIITGLSIQVIALLDQWAKPAQNAMAQKP